MKLVPAVLLPIVTLEILAVQRVRLFSPTGRIVLKGRETRPVTRVTEVCVPMLEAPTPANSPTSG
jgi:hypothetical protein